MSFEVRIFVIVYFQLRKKELDWSTVLVGSIRYLFSQLKENKYSKFRQISESPDDIPRTLKKHVSNSLL